MNGKKCILIYSILILSSIVMKHKKTFEILFPYYYLELLIFINIIALISVIYFIKGIRNVCYFFFFFNFFFLLFFIIIIYLKF